MTAKKEFSRLNQLLYSLKEWAPDFSRKTIANIALASVSALGTLGLIGTTYSCAPKSSAAPTPPAQTITNPVEPVQPTPVVQTYTVKGTVYHDKNGDGIKEMNEPGIPGVEIDLYSGPTNIKSIKSDSNGAYSIQVDEKGTYSLSVDKNNVNGPNDQHYRYINISKSEFKRTSDKLDIEVNGDVERDIALMQGFLTLPFGPDTKFLGNNQFGIRYYVDIDFTIGSMRNWKGDTAEGYVGAQTYDNHQGTDFFMEENTPILAAAPGVVVPYEPSCDPVEGCFVIIQHESPYTAYYSPDTFYSIDTIYGHLNKVNVKGGDKVKREDVIGFSGKVIGLPPIIDAYNGRHLHFEVDLLTKPTLSPGTLSLYYCDPYRNIKTEGLQNIGFWTVDNEPQYP
jgi:murein DD-endopeptidase MepM/ murein hydrolase activator NlpD